MTLADSFARCVSVRCGVGAPSGGGGGEPSVCLFVVWAAEQHSPSEIARATPPPPADNWGGATVPLYVGQVCVSQNVLQLFICRCILQIAHRGVHPE